MASAELNAFLASLDEGLSEEERRRRVQDFIEGRLSTPDEPATFGEKLLGTGQAISRGAQEFGPSLKRTAGGVLQAVGGHGFEPSQFATIPDFLAERILGKERLEGLQRTMAEQREELDAFTGRRDKTDLELTGEALRDIGTEELQAIGEPKTKTEKFIRDFTREALNIGPPIVGAALTRKPSVALAPIGLRVFGESVGEAKERGQGQRESIRKGLLDVAAEIIPESIPLGIMTRRGLSLVKRILLSGPAELVQENVTEALQTGIARSFGEDISLSEAMERQFEASKLALPLGLFGANVGHFSNVYAEKRLTGENASTALNLAIEEEFEEETPERDFADTVAKGRRGKATAAERATFIDVILDTGTVRVAGTNPNLLAQQIETMGLERAGKINNLSEREMFRIGSALGSGTEDAKKPSYFGVRRFNLAKDQSERKRQQAVRLISTNDVATEFQALSNNQKAVTLLSEPLTAQQHQAATELGLKVVKINSPQLDKGKNAVRVVYNPRLARALFLGLQQDRHAGRRSLVGNFKDEEAWIKTMARKNPRALGVLSAGSLGTDFAGNVKVNLTRGGEIIRSSTVNGADVLSEADLLLTQAAEETAGVSGLPVVGRKVDGFPVKRPRRMTTKEKQKQGGAEGEFAITIEGEPIEELAALNNVPEANLRQIQRDLSDLGMQHMEATALAGALTGSADALQRENLIKEAARIIQAVRPDVHPTVGSANVALDQALKKIDKDLPEEAKFFRFQEGPESESGPVAPRQPPPEGPPSPPPKPQAQLARILGVEVVEDKDVAPTTPEEATETQDVEAFDPEYRPIPGMARKTRDRLTGQEIMQNTFEDGLIIEMRRYDDHLEVAPSLNKGTRQSEGHGHRAYRGFVLKQGEHLGLPVWSAVPERFKDMRSKAQVLTGKNRNAEGLWKGLVRDGLAYWDPQMLRYVQILPGVTVPPHGVTDVERAGERVVIDGVPLDLKSPVEAARLAQGQSAHPTIEPESSVELTMRRMQQQTVEQALAQRQEVRQLEDQLVAQAREQIGEALSEEDARDLLFTETEDPVAGAQQIIRRAGLNLASENVGHEEAIRQTIEQVLGIREQALGVYRAHPAVLMREAAVRLSQAEDASFGAGAELMETQSRRQKLSDDIVREWRLSMAMLAKNDRDGAAPHLDKMDAARAEFVKEAERARELDTNVTEAQKQMAEAAEQAPTSEDADLVRRGARSEVAEQYAGTESYVAAVMKNEGKSEAHARDQLSDIRKEGWESALPDGSFQNNLTMVDAAYGGEGPSARALLRTDSELNPLVRGIYSFGAGILVSPQTAINRSLAEAGRAMSTSFEVHHQNQLAWNSKGQDLGTRLRRLMHNETDRYYTGRYIENDYQRIDPDWLEEIQQQQTPKAQAVQAFIDEMDQAREDLANHVKLPVYRRLRDWFGRFRDSGTIVEMLQKREKDLKKQLQETKVKGKKVAGGLSAELEAQLKEVQKDLVTFTKEKKDRRSMLSWEDTRVPKEARYDSLLERTGNLADYVKDPVDMLMMAWRQAGRYAFLKNMLPQYDDAIKRLGGTVGPEGQINVGKKSPVIVQRLAEGKKLLWTPPDQITATIQNIVDDAFIEAGGQLPIKRGIAAGAVAGAAVGAVLGGGPVGATLGAVVGGRVGRKVVVDPAVVARTSRFIKRAGFYMHLGLRASSAALNLTTLATHTAVVLGAKDSAKGMARYLMDQAVTGDMARAIPGIQDLIKEESKRIGSNVSPIKSLYDEVVTDLQTHFWELADAPDLSALRAMLEGQQSAVAQVFSIMFHATEAVNRGATFYTAADRAIRVLEYFQEHGSLKGLPDRAYMDGYIAKSKKGLEDDWKLLRRRLPKLRELQAALAGDLTTEQVQSVAEEMADLGAPPQRMSELEQLMKTGKNASAREWFDLEAEVREAAASQAPMQWVKEVATAAMNSTQLTYSRKNRPVWVGRMAPVLELTTALTDFARSELEFFWQVLDTGKKLAFLGILYAMGGWKVLPGLAAMFEILLPDADDDDDLKAWLSRAQDTPWGGGLAWAVGANVVLRLRPTLWLAERLSETTYERLSTVEKLASGIGGSSIQPFIDANAAIRETSERTRFNADRLGIDYLAQARIETKLPEAGLRQSVPAGNVPLGKLFMHPWVAGKSPSDALAWMSTIGALPDAMQARLAVTSEAFRVKPHGMPGYLEVPGDSLVQIAGVVRDIIGSGQRAAGAKLSRGRPTAPVDQTLGAKLSNLMGLAPTDESLIREITRMGSAQIEHIDKGRKAFIHYAFSLRKATPRGESRPLTPREIVELGASRYPTLTERTVLNNIIQLHNPLIGRFAAKLSKEGTEWMWNDQNLEGQIEEAIKNTAAIGDKQAVSALIGTRISSARRYFSAVGSRHEASRTPWTTDEIGQLAITVKKVPDVRLKEMLSEITSGVPPSSGGRTRSTFRINQEAGDIMAAALSRDPDLLFQVATRHAGDDLRRREDLFTIGLYLMDYQSQRLEAVQ